MGLGQTEAETQKLGRLGGCLVRIPRATSKEVERNAAAYFPCSNSATNCK